MDSPPVRHPFAISLSRRAGLPTPSHLEGIPAGVREGGEGEYATAHQMVRFSEHSTFGGREAKVYRRRCPPWSGDVLGSATAQVSSRSRAKQLATRLQSSVDSLVIRRVRRSVYDEHIPGFWLSLWGHRRGRLKRNVWQTGRARANKVANAPCPATVLPQNLQYPQLRHRPGSRWQAFLASGCLVGWGGMAAPRGVPNP